MQIILKESVRGLGKVGQVVDVSPGYARNFLCPEGKALPMSKENTEIVKKLVVEVEAREKQEREEAMKLKEKIEQVEAITITVQVKEDSTLYGAVGVTELQEALSKSGLDIDRKDIHLLGGSVKATGDYTARIDVYHDIQADVNFAVVAEVENTQDD